MQSWEVRREEKLLSGCDIYIREKEKKKETIDITVAKTQWTMNYF